MGIEATVRYSLPFSLLNTLTTAFLAGIFFNFLELFDFSLSRTTFCLGFHDVFVVPKLSPSLFLLLFFLPIVSFITSWICLSCCRTYVVYVVSILSPCISSIHAQVVTALIQSRTGSPISLFSAVVTPRPTALSHRVAPLHSSLPSLHSLAFLVFSFVPFEYLHCLPSRFLCG